MSDLHRHIEACNNTPSPAHLLPFRIGDHQVGWVAPELARALTFHPRDVHFDGRGVALASRHRSPGARSAALEALCAELAPRGHLRVRGERFDVRPTAEGPTLATLDRGALPAFGVIGQGVHLNGLVRRADGLHVWVGVRARDKAVAPGELDNVVAGGIPAGLTPEQCLIKEAEEEAGMPAAMAAQARRTGRISYILTLPEGLRRDVLHVYDIDLPEDFTPRPNDDEVERFELWPAARLLEAVRETEDVKFNVNLVLIDLFLREGLIDAGSAEGQRLRAGLNAGP
jgi:8-oxo-dGTP pyrophosphatase MutT (NUDIX family)